MMFYIYDLNIVTLTLFFMLFQFNSFHRTALHEAVEKKSKNIVMMLLNHKDIDIYAKDEIFQLVFNLV